MGRFDSPKGCVLLGRATAPFLLLLKILTGEAFSRRRLLVPLNRTEWIAFTVGILIFDWLFAVVEMLRKLITAKVTTESEADMNTNDFFLKCGNDPIQSGLWVRRGKRSFDFSMTLS